MSSLSKILQPADTDFQNFVPILGAESIQAGEMALYCLEKTQRILSLELILMAQ